MSEVDSLRETVQVAECEEALVPVMGEGVPGVRIHGRRRHRHQVSWIVTGVVRLWRERSHTPSSFSATASGISRPSR